MTPPLYHNPRILSQQEMLARGADGHLSRAIEQDIPLHKIDGREPTPAASEGNPYTKGQQITQPIEVQHSPENDSYMLYAGNHRVHQAEINGQTHIRAFVEPDDGRSFRKIPKPTPITQIPMQNSPSNDWSKPLPFQLSSYIRTAGDMTQPNAPKFVRTTPTGNQLSAVDGGKNNDGEIEDPLYPGVDQHSRDVAFGKAEHGTTPFNNYAPPGHF